MELDVYGLAVKCIVEMEINLIFQSFLQKIGLIVNLMVNFLLVEANFH